MAKDSVGLRMLDGYPTLAIAGYGKCKYKAVHGPGEYPVSHLVPATVGYEGESGVAVITQEHLDRLAADPDCSVTVSVV